MLGAETAACSVVSVLRTMSTTTIPGCAVSSSMRTPRARVVRSVVVLARGVPMVLGRPVVRELLVVPRQLVRVLRTHRGVVHELVHVVVGMATVVAHDHLAPDDHRSSVHRVPFPFVCA